MFEQKSFYSQITPLKPTILFKVTCLLFFASLFPWVTVGLGYLRLRPVRWFPSAAFGYAMEQKEINSFDLSQ